MHDAEKRLWAEIETVNKSFAADRLRLGKLFYQLRNLYSERSDSAARRLSSGHGVFQAEIKRRGFRPNRVREMIVDYEVEQGMRPPTESTAAKRKARRSDSAEYQRGYNAAIRSTHAGIEDSPLTRFCELLSFRERQRVYRELRCAYRVTLQEVHPDHGGDAERTRELIAAWEAVEQYFSDERTAEQGTVTVSAYTH